MNKISNFFRKIDSWKKETSQVKRSLYNFVISLLAIGATFYAVIFFMEAHYYSFGIFKMDGVSFPSFATQLRHWFVFIVVVVIAFSLWRLIISLRYIIAVLAVLILLAVVTLPI